VPRRSPVGRSRAGEPRVAAETYIRAAEERVRQAQELVRPDQCALAHYVAGVAVECVIRAFRVRAKAEFDAKHNLRNLVKQSEFYDFMPPAVTAQVAASVFEVERRWDNLHRYRDVSSLRRWLVERKLHVGVKGDVVRHSRDAIVEAALDIVTKGVVRWRLGPRSRTR